MNTRHASSQFLAQKNLIELLRYMQQEIDETGKAVTPLLDSLVKSSKESIPQLVASIEEVQWLVPVIGAFSAGKSSLLNDFIGKNCLPVSITPETALAAELHYDENERIEAIVLASGETQTHPLTAFAELSKQAKDYQYFRVYVNSPNLKQIEPLVLVDMPGFDAPLEAHQKAIANMIDRGTHYIFVQSIEDGALTRQCIRRMQEVLDSGKGLSLVVSKTNLKPQSQRLEVVSHIKDQAQTAFGRSIPIAALGITDLAGPFNRLLSEIDRTHTVHSIFRAPVESVYFDLRTGLLNTASALVKNEAQIKETLKSLLEATEVLEAERDRQLKQAQNSRDPNAIESILTTVDVELRNALEELVEATLKSPDSAANLINDIVRAALSQGIRDYKTKISNDSIDGFISATSSGGQFTVKMEDDWLMNLLELANNVPILKVISGIKVVAKVGGPKAMVLAVVAEAAQIAIGIAKSERKRSLLKDEFEMRVIPETLRRLRVPLESFLAKSKEEVIMRLAEQFNQQIKTKQAAYETAKAEQDRDLSQIHKHRSILESANQKISDRINSVWVNQ
jgi:hypothetical protein